jgi:hypothetical protein
MTDTRNATLQDLVRVLETEQARKVDIVVPAASLSVEGGNLIIPDYDNPVLTEDGVSPRLISYRPTDVAEDGISDRLGIPRQYLRKLRTDLPELWDANVSGWLAKMGADNRKYLLRTLRPEGPDGGEGVLRAFLGNSYFAVDNLDALYAALAGIQQADHKVKIASADLSDRRMVVRVESEAIAVAAPELLKGYRSPYKPGLTGDQLPLISAGFVIQNSETGSGAFDIRPWLRVRVCDNGLVLDKGEAFRRTHLGARLEEGVVQVSEDTRRANLALITSQAADAVNSFLDAEYVRRQVAKLEEKSGKPISDPDKTIKVVSKQLGFSEDQQKSILSFFIQGGQVTAGGVMQAVTAAAQSQESADAAWDMESKGVAALEAAYAAA